MRKQSIALLALLLIFWLAVSGSLDGQHLWAGAFLAVITVWFWQDLGPRLPHLLSAGEFLRFSRVLLLLAMYVILSNWAVVKTLLFASPPARPVFVVMQPSLRTNWGRILLATFITLTPGTVTVDVDPETGRFIVHALTEETAISLFYWKMIGEIEALEDYRQRRMAHVVDSGRLNDLDTDRAR